MINIVFADLSRSKEARHCVHQKLSAAFEDLPGADLDRLTHAACKPAHRAPLPLLARGSVPRLSQAQHSSVARKMCLFIAAVDRLSPLLDGGFKRSDAFCTLLTHDAGPTPRAYRRWCATRTMRR